MRYFLSTSILVLATLSPLIKALPYYEDTDPQYFVEFECGYDVDNWVIEAGFGTPEQDARLLVDTTSNNTFVAGIMCHSEFCENQSGPLYDSGKSSTSVKLMSEQTFELTNNRSVLGDIYEDTVTIGNIEFTNFKFGKAISVSGFPSDADYAGVYGLNPGPDPTYYASKRKRADHGKGKPSMRGREGKSGSSGSVDTSDPPNVQIPKKRSNTGGGKCALIYDLNYDTLPNPIAWLNLPTNDCSDSPFWKTDIECVKIKNVVDLKFQNTIAEFDTAVKDITAPHEDIAKIHQGLNAEYDNDSDKYVFQCCDANDLEISFTDYTVKIPAGYWTVKIDDNRCFAKIAVSDATDAPTSRWRLGTDFMENFYTILDEDRRQTGLSLLNNRKGISITPK
ncbi:aspartic peptidase domain-containing protein [Pilaira anomala]|nr:aspartic peptidase domain-containing protein [Pilaira anomala]